MPSSRSCRSSYDCIVKIKGVTMRPILFSQLMRSDGGSLTGSPESCELIIGQPTELAESTHQP